MSFKVYCKVFLMAIIGVIIAASVPCLIGAGLTLLSFPIWGIVIGCLIAAFFSLYATIKYIDKYSEPNSWFLKK